MNHNLLSAYANHLTNSNHCIEEILTILRNQHISFDNIIHLYQNDNSLQSNINRHSRIYHPVSPFPIPSYNRPNPFNLSHSHLPRRSTHANINSPPHRFVQEGTIPSNIRNIITDINSSILQPVIIRPTLEQLQNAIIRSSFKDIDNPLNYVCPISQTDFSADDQIIQLISCKHIFTPNSILQWFQNNTKCPLCRCDIRESVDSSNNSTSTTTDANTTEANTTDANTTDANTTEANTSYISNNIINRLNEAITQHINNNQELSDTSHNLIIEVLINNERISGL